MSLVCVIYGVSFLHTIVLKVPLGVVLPKKMNFNMNEIADDVEYHLLTGRKPVEPRPPTKEEIAQLNQKVISDFVNTPTKVLQV